MLGSGIVRPIALSAVVSLTRHRVPVHPPCCPPAAPSSGFPFPPPGPLGAVPRLHRYNGKLRLPATLPAALRRLRLAVPPSACRLLPHPPDAAVAGQGNSCLASPTPVPLFSGDDRTSQVPGGPPSVHALLFDPGGFSSPSLRGDSMLPSAN